MKARTLALLVPIVIVTLIAIASCGDTTTTTTPTPTTTTTITTPTPTTTTTTTPTPTTTTTTTTTTTEPLFPELVSLGHDFYAVSSIPVCLFCHDIGKTEELPSDHGGSLPPALTAEMCLICHKLGTVTESPPPWEEVPSEEWTVMETHPLEGFDKCITCHGGTNKGSMIQPSPQHGCTQCHHAAEENLMPGADGFCPELTGADYWASCVICHKAAE